MSPATPIPRLQERLLWIVDGHAFAYRAFFAIPPLTSPDGAPTNAILGFIKMLEKGRDKVQPTHQVVVWDGGLAVQRLAVLPEYKAQRPPMPEKLVPQMAGLDTYLEAAGIAAWRRPGVEADDAIADLTRQAAEAGARVVIGSSDKDFMQLVSPRVELLNPGDRTQTVLGTDQVRAKTGVGPGQIVDWLSLVGDTVDNIPGVPGIGPKTATKLLVQFGSLVAVLDRLNEIASRSLRQRLEAGGTLARQNQGLVRLNDRVGVELEWPALAVRSPDQARLHALYRDWGFQSLLPKPGPGTPRQPDWFAGFC